MASLFRFRGKWVVSHREDGKQRQHKFATEQEARAFLADNGMTHNKRGEMGRQARTADDLRNHIADSMSIDESGCWAWTKSLTSEGYGRLTWQRDGKSIAGAHRLSYHLAVEPVPADMVIDHLCRNRACVNPDHLEVVLQRENVMRSPIAQGALNAAKTHCIRGHEYSPENTYVYSTPSPRKTTQRVCKTCRAEYRRAYAARKRAAQNGVAA